MNCLNLSIFRHGLYSLKFISHLSDWELKLILEPSFLSPINGDPLWRELLKFYVLHKLSNIEWKWLPIFQSLSGDSLNTLVFRTAWKSIMVYISLLKHENCAIFFKNGESSWTPVEGVNLDKNLAKRRRSEHWKSQTI